MNRLTNVSYSVKTSADIRKVILSGINLSIPKGTRTGILGPNGSGKTTLVKLMAGLLPPDSGEIRVDSLLTSDETFRQKLGQKVGVLFQNPEHQIISINVERELAFGLENFALPSEEIQARVEQQLRRFNLQSRRHYLTSQLSGGEKQLVALAAVMILRPEILIMDEPTAHVDQAGKDKLWEAIEMLKCDGQLTLIYVTQIIDEVKDFDRILVVSEGIIREDCNPEQFLRAKKKFAAYQLDYPYHLFENNRKPELINWSMDFASTGVSRRSLEGAIPLLSAREIHFGWSESGWDEIIGDLDLEIHAGVVHGICGRSGCGKTTLALILAGLLLPQKGKLGWQGGCALQQTLLREVSYLFQFPERGMFADNLYEDIAYGPRNFGRSEKDLPILVEHAMNDVGLDFEAYKGRSPFSLSGGEARLAAMAGAIACDKRCLIFDEPIEELDHAGKEQVKRLLRNLASALKAIMVISHDSDFLFEVCDRVSIWQDRKLLTYDKYELYDHAEEFLQSGVRIPHLIELAQRLSLSREFRAAGIDSYNHPALRDLFD